MISSINFGNLLTVGNKTITTGGSSGLDTATLITALVDAKRIPINAIINKQAKSSATIDTLSQYRSLLSSFKSVSNALRNPPGITAVADNVFEARTSFLNSNTGVAAGTYLAVNVSPGATLASYTAEVLNLAEAQQIRTSNGNGYGSKTDDITSTGTGAITEGTFRIASFAHTNISDSLAGVDYSTQGAGAGIVTAINNFAVAGSNGGDTNLIGTISGFSGVHNGADDNDFSITINGVVYEALDVDDTVNSPITFTDSATGTSFDVTLTAPQNANNQGQVDTLVAALDTGVAGISIYQSREMGNFDESRIQTGDLLEGLKSSHISLTSDGYNLTDGTHGAFEEFNVTAVSAPGNNDGVISVVIDGETYEATGLGDDGADTEASNITLSSTSTDKSLTINLADAGVVLDLSDSTNAAQAKTALNYTFSVRAADVTVDAGDSLVDIVGSINAKSATTGVSASVIKASDNDFRLVLTSNNTGIGNGFVLLDSGGAVFGSPSPFGVVQAAENAQLSLDGLTIERNENVITDAVDGATFAIFQETPALTNVTVEIASDPAAALEAIINFVAAFNEARVFEAQQTQRDEDGKLINGAVLGNNTLLRTTNDGLTSIVTGEVLGLSASQISSLAEIGITLTDFDGDADTPEVGNIFEVDQSKLTDALATDFDAVRQIFEFSINSTDNDKIAIFKTPLNLQVNEFSIDIDTGRAAGDEVQVTYDPGSGPVTINMDFVASSTGGLLKGQAGTDFEGLEIIYVGDGTDIINSVSVTQGLADKIYNYVNGVINTGGPIDAEVESLESRIDQFDKDIERIERQIEIFRETQIRRFSALEEALSTVNSTLQLLDAQNAAREAAGG